MQKKKNRMMANSKKMDSWQELRETTEILPFYSQKIFSLLLYVVNNIYRELISP
jgi:hypothetical protein